MADLHLILAGQEAKGAAEALNPLLVEGEQNLVVSQYEPSALPEVRRKVIDPLSIAALVLALPGAVLATTDIVDRIRKRKKAQSLIEAAKRLKDESGVQISIVVVDGTPRALDQLTADGLLEIAGRLEGAG